MIIGIGTDLCVIARIEAMLEKHGDRLLDRLLTDYERSVVDCRNTQMRSATVAKRFAAKEACAKALGTGIAKGVGFKDIGVESDSLGRPSLVLTGGAKVRLDAMMPGGHAPKVHLSISDDGGMALAYVVIEARNVAIFDGQNHDTNLDTSGEGWLDHASE